MLALGVYVRDFLGMTQAQFERSHPACVLLVDSSAFDSESESVSFETVALTRRDDDAPQGRLVFPITKNEKNPWPERISLGRARNCDVVMRHPSVSKLHAHFFVGAPKLGFSDHKSTNGCKLNKIPLEPGERVSVSCGDLLCIGTVEATLYSPAGFFQLVQNIHARDSKPSNG